jgi:aryl-alcohol dehydrogenase-like predicted oxidoreductase
MQYTTLGQTDLKVSQLCLGSMTWGSQNTEGEGHAQIDVALDHGINFIDTAEMYPVNPIAKETVGRTEAIIGTWLAAHGRREQIVLATKVSGEGLLAVRDGAPITPQTIREALEGSLKRLQTDYVDLYQLHWPNRGSYHFRKNWTYDPSAQNKAETLTHMAEVLEELEAQVKAGRIRHFGLSNETAWGTAQWLRLSEQGYGPRPQAIQNEYSLLCRHFDTDMGELSVNEDVTLLAYSPLAAGYLSGKYQDGAVPDRSRMTVNPTMGGRATDRVHGAVSAYMSVAQKYGLDPVQMALAWCYARPFKTIPIFGATRPDQLKMALGAADMALDKEVLADLEATHKAYPLPF